jgi:hypothetical protein
MATGATFQNIFFPFLPTSIAGCQLWLDAADAATIVGTSSVTAWTDKSGKGNNPTFGANKPSYTNNSIITANANQQFTVPSSTIATSTGTGSIFMIYGDQQTGSNGGYSGLFGTANPSERFFQCLLRPDGNAYAVNSPFSPGATITNVMNTTSTLLYNMNYIYNSSTGTLRLNGTNYASSFGGTPIPSGALTLSSTGWGDVANVRLYEVLTYTGATALTVPQQQQIEGYLAWKWGLQANLPPDHPYKSGAPVGSGPAFNTSQITTIPLTIQKNRNFVPTQISGCQLWMDAADSTTITRSGVNVTQWNDKANNYSGSATNNPQYNSSPINGLPTIHFDGASNRYVLISANNYNYSFMTYFIVIRWVSGTTGGFMGTDTPGNYGRALAVSSSNVQLLLYSQFYTTTVALTANQPCILSAYFNGTTNFTVILNGTPTVFAVGQGAGNTNTNGFNIGVFNPGNSGNHSFDMGEGIVYNSILSDAQRQQVEGYLAWKWGLTASLPPGHPYLNNNNYYNPFPTTTPSKTISISSIFKPTNYAGCQLWLDAFDPFGNGSRQKSPLTLTRWVDKSSSARHANMFNGSSISYSPTAFNNKPALLFTQTQNMSSAAAAGTFPTIFTFFMIYQRTGGGTYDTLVTRTVSNLAAPLDFYTATSSGNFSRNIGNGGAQSGYNTTSGSNFTNVTTPSLYYANATAASGLLDAFNFATPVDPSSGMLTGVYYADNGTSIYIGTRADSVTTLTASVSEVIVYSTTPTDQQRQTIEGYLAWKWGLVASLPAGHPYKNYPPPPQ